MLKVGPGVGARVGAWVGAGVGARVGAGDGNNVGAGKATNKQGRIWGAALLQSDNLQTWPLTRAQRSMKAPCVECRP